MKKRKLQTRCAEMAQRRRSHKKQLVFRSLVFCLPPLVSAALAPATTYMALPDVNYGANYEAQTSGFTGAQLYWDVHYAAQNGPTSWAVGGYSISNIVTTYPNAVGDIAILQDEYIPSGGTQPVFGYTDSVINVVEAGGGPVTLGGLELDVDNDQEFYDIRLPITFDNTPNGFANITMGGVGGATDPGLSRIDSQIQLNTNLNITGLNLRIDGGITGNKGIVSNLTGTLYLYDDSKGTVPSNTFSGGVSVNGGSVQINNDSELGAPAAGLTLNGATLVNGANTLLSGHQINLQGNGTLSTPVGTTFAAEGVISGPGALTIAGSGTYQLGNTSSYAVNSYTGGTILLGNATGKPTLQIFADSNLGDTTVEAPITFNSTSKLETPVLQIVSNLSFSTNRNIVLTTDGEINVPNSQVFFLINGQISGPGALVITGAIKGAGYNAVLLGDLSNTYSGGTDLNAGGNLYITSDAQLGSGPLSFNGGALIAVGFTSLHQTINGSMAATMSVPSGTAMSLSGAINSAGLVKQGAGVITLTNTLNTYGYITDIQAGTIQFSDDRQLGAASTPVNFSGGNLEATASTSSARAYTGQGSNSITITLDSGVVLTNSGMVGGSGNASALIVNGVGTLALTNTANNYSGGTTINGTLSVPADGSLGTSNTAITFGQTQIELGLFRAGTLVTTQSFSTSRSITLGTYGGQFNPAAGTTLTLNGPVSGRGPIIVNGPGTLVYNSSNAASTGGAVVYGGTLTPGSSAAYGLGPITLAGGTLALGLVNSVQNIPAAVTGFNQDVVVDRSATTGNFRSFISRGFDSTNTASGYAFYENGYAGVTSSGLPQNHTFPSATNPYVGFTLASYSGPNVLQLASGFGGTLTLNSKAFYSGISILDASANGSGLLNVVVNFTDGTNLLVTTVSVPDWYTNTPGALSVNGRVSLTNGAIQTSAGNPALYEQDITFPAADADKQISAISFSNATNSSNQMIGVFAITGYVPSQEYTNAITVQANSTLNISGAPIVSIQSLNLSSGKLSLTTALPKVQLQLNALTQSGTGAIDIGSNDFVVNNGNLASIRSMVASGYNGGAWTGAGIDSSTAAADSKHLTALGVIQNSVDGTPTGTVLYPTLDGNLLSDTDVIVRYTYYGDANLDGKIDGSDYSRIDNGFTTHLTGWFNGDFNYDGVVDGSDYTLIDNAFNGQGAALTSEIAAATGQLAGPTSVPEPAALAAAMMSAGLLGRRRRR